MKLIPEQIIYLRKRERELKEAIASYQDYLTSRDKSSIEHSIGTFVGDKFTDDQYQMDQDSYTSVINLLTDAEYITNRDTKTIQIGTKFIIEFTNTPMTDAIILTDAIFGLPIVFNESLKFVSCASPLGKSVIGKKEGEIISYNLPQGHLNTKVEGTIKEIIGNPQEYLHFIRERKFHNRISKAARRELHCLLESNDLKAKEEYARRQEITASQKMLLMIEGEQLARTASDPVKTARLKNIKKLLTNSALALPPADGTIGIGSRFEIMLSDGSKTETQEAELINRAVTSELEEEYVERISPLGTKVFGLRIGDTFKVQKSNKIYTGLVVDVDNKMQTNGIAMQKK